MDKMARFSIGDRVSIINLQEAKDLDGSRIYEESSDGKYVIQDIGYSHGREEHYYDLRGCNNFLERFLMPTTCIIFNIKGDKDE